MALDETPKATAGEPKKSPFGNISNSWRSFLQVENAKPQRFPSPNYRTWQRLIGWHLHALNDCPARFQSVVGLVPGQLLLLSVVAIG